ncbi:sensor histidine kinase [Lentzea sp. HUAS TT2]|uniref:sensor histidine kinase n=1 Tax=Lentzea sp. HUAS TT2 TaxID=3447454 RepID=UPI003F6E7535
MRRHLVAVLTVLPTVVAFVLGLPLAMHRIDRAGQELVIQRLSEAEQLVHNAAAVLRREGAADMERLRDYRQRTDVNVVVVDTLGQSVFGSPCAGATPPPMEQESVRVALRGGHLESADYSVNDGRRELVVATPVIDEGRHWGVVVTCSSLESLRTHAWTVWATTAVVAFLAIALSAGLAEPLARWLLRPVRLFDRAAHRFAAGDYGARVSVGSGPPELRVLGETFNRMADQLQHTLQTQRSFVGDASHQLRNPLVALQLRLENLEPYVPAGGASQMNAALQEAARMGLILNALLTLARAENRHQPHERIDVIAVLIDRTASWRLSAETTDVHIEVAPGAGGWVSALPGTLDQIVDVFLDNAIRASPPGGRIVLAATSHGQTISISCRDEGPGMTAEEAARACDRFWRGPQTLDTDGSGLGLSIAVSLADASNGRIHLRPAPVGGLDATVVLPEWPWSSTTASETRREDRMRS